MIKSKGVNFPPYKPSEYELAEPIKRQRTLPINYSDEEVGPSQSQVKNYSDEYLDTSSFNEKKKKLYKDLLVVLENIDLTNSIINERGDREIIKTMVANLNQMENKFDALKRKLKASGETELYTFTEDLLKEIMRIYSRVNTLGKTKKMKSYLARNTLAKKCKIFTTLK